MSKYVDYIKGMMLLGIYGDALGAPHETNALKGKVINPNNLGKLQLTSMYHPTSGARGPWWIWAEPSAVANLRGVPTDDSAYRLMILHPWLMQNHKNDKLFSEENHVAWMRENNHPAQEALASGVALSYTEQIDAWMKMIDAAENQKSEGFYNPNFPVFFGSFLYLESAIFFRNNSDRSIYRRFWRMSSLDGGIGKIVTGIMAALLVRCFNADQVNETEILAHLSDSVTEIVSTIPGPHRRDAEQLIEIKEKIILQTAELDIGEAIEFINLQMKTFNALPSHNLKPFSSLLLWKQFWSYVSFARKKPLHSLAVAAAGPGDSDTVAMFLGIIHGALLGYERLEKISINDIQLADELKVVASNCKTVFGVDINESAKAFAKLIESDHSPA